MMGLLRLHHFVCSIMTGQGSSCAINDASAASFSSLCSFSQYWRASFQSLFSLVVYARPTEVSWYDDFKCITIGNTRWTRFFSFVSIQRFVSKLIVSPCPWGAIYQSLYGLIPFNHSHWILAFTIHVHRYTEWLNDWHCPLPGNDISWSKYLMRHSLDDDSRRLESITPKFCGERAGRHSILKLRRPRTVAIPHATTAALCSQYFMRPSSSNTVIVNWTDVLKTLR